MTIYVVTGASGFIGNNLVKYLSLDDNNFVYAVVRNKQSNIDSFDGVKNVKVIYCDMDNISQLNLGNNQSRADIFIHLAWEGSTGALRANYAIQMKNVVFTCDALEVAERLHCKRFLCAGTISENLVDSIYDIKNPSQNMIYAFAKKTAHNLLDILCKKREIEFIWMQFSNVYGPGNNSGNLISYTFNEIIKGNTPIFGSGKQPYDFIFIDDLVSYIELLATKELHQQTYFIGSGKVVLLKEYILAIPRIIGKDVQIGLGMRPDDDLVYLPEWFLTDNLEKDTGFKSKVNFQEGILKTYKWLEGKKDD